MDKLGHQVIVDFRDGNISAFELIFKAYYSLIITFSQKLTGNQDEAEDTAIEVFSSLFQRRQLFKDEHHVKAFLYVSARNRCITYLNARKRHDVSHNEIARRMERETLLTYEYSIKAELILAIHRAIEKLPEECQKIFKMLYYEEMKPVEVAILLGISVNTVYVQKSRAVNVLRIALAEYQA